MHLLALYLSCLLNREKSGLDNGVQAVVNSISILLFEAKKSKRSADGEARPIKALVIPLNKISGHT